MGDHRTAAAAAAAAAADDDDDDDCDGSYGAPSSKDDAGLSFHSPSYPAVDYYYY